jgi:hypothetical protein
VQGAIFFSPGDVLILVLITAVVVFTISVRSRNIKK